MINLAGKKDCDFYIKVELTRCGIPIEDSPRSSAISEVPYSLQGKIKTNNGDLVFTRAWRYWVVKGEVPLDVANKLYADSASDDIRVDGHCGNVPPEDPWIKRIDKEGRQLVLDEDLSQRKAFKEFNLDPSKYHFINNKDNLDLYTHRAFIETYHIDSEMGLRVFADTIKSNNNNL